MAQCISVEMTRRASSGAAMSRLPGAGASLTVRHAVASLDAIGGSARPSLGHVSAVSVGMKARGAEPNLFSYCPINYTTSAQGMGGWNNNLGWDNNIGWKN